MLFDKFPLHNSADDLWFKAKIFDEVFEKAYEGIVIVDKNAQVIYINNSAREIVNLKQAEILNKHVADVIPGSRLPIVLKTGKMEIGWSQWVGGKEGIVHRIPIIYNDEIVGAIGIVMFRDLQAVEKTFGKLNLHIKKDENYFSRIGAKYSIHNIIGNSYLINKAKEEARKVSCSEFSVLIIGETGTGKELFAHAIHDESPASKFPFIRINCASIPSQLLESELFGHEKGAFTGAQTTKQGKFEIAGHGTILLDEIGEMDLTMQSKLLRVLEDKEFERVGGIKTIPLRARIIASTNKNLFEQSKQGKFRLDLYHRLNTVELRIPALRDRKEDILFLFEHFRKLYPVGELSSESMEVLLSYDWPGNVRELQNLVKRLSILKGEKRVIEASDLPDYFYSTETRLPVEPETSEMNHFDHLSERDLLLHVLLKTKGNKAKAAKLLQISRPTLYNKMKKYKLDHPAYQRQNLS